MGNDTLTGGAGADNFDLKLNDDAPLSLVKISTITDFVVADDMIIVDNNDFGRRLTPGEAITTDQFVVGSAAHDQSDRFIYNKNTGALFFDPDGTGATKYSFALIRSEFLHHLRYCI